MKHEVTSLQTKKLLAGALKTCMETKPLSKVTVNELIGVCGLNRNTFYYHFNDIYALLEWMLRQETVEVLSHFELLTDYEEAILYVLDYIEKNKHILSCAYDAVGQAGLKRFFFNDCYQIVENAVADLEKSPASAGARGVPRVSLLVLHRGHGRDAIGKGHGENRLFQSEAGGLSGREPEKHHPPGADCGR